MCPYAAAVLGILLQQSFIARYLSSTPRNKFRDNSLRDWAVLKARVSDTTAHAVGMSAT